MEMIICAASFLGEAGTRRDSRLEWQAFGERRLKQQVFGEIADWNSRYLARETFETAGIWRDSRLEQ